MFIDRTHFHLFPRREVGALSVTLALQYFGSGLVGVFVPVLFWQSGFSIPDILFFYFLNSIFFVLLTFLFLPLIKKLSDKMMIFLSIPALVFYYLGLQYVTAVPALFYVLPIFLAANALLFNVGYNLAFSKSSDSNHIGREIGIRDSISSFVQFGAPLIGGLLIVNFGFYLTFLIAAIILVFSVFPLIVFPRRNLEPDGKRIEMLKYIKHRLLRPFNISSVGYAMEVAVSGVLWPLFVYIAVGSISDLGGVISAGLFAAMVITLFVGFLSDAGKRRIILAWSTVLYAFIYIARIFWTDSAFVVANHVAGGVVYAALLVAWVSEFYKITRAISDFGAFILSQQILFQIARACYFLLLIVFAMLFSTSTFFVVCFGCTALLVLLFLYANEFHVSTIQKEGV